MPVARSASDLNGAPYVDVSITLFRTPAQALASLLEPAYRAGQVLRNGARVRIAFDGGGIESVIRNVAISTVSSHAVTGHTGPDVHVSAQMRIHGRIQSAVLEVR